MDEEEKWSIEKTLGLFTAIAIFTIPTIGINNSTGDGHPILETALLWPWLILVRFEPQEELFQSDMYNFVLPPWTFVIFIPFLITLRYAYLQFNHVDDKEKTAGLIALLSIAQIFIIWMSYQSQELGVEEDITIYYIPQLLILLVQGIFGLKWYSERIQKTLNTPNTKPKEQQIEEQQIEEQQIEEQHIESEN